MKRDFSVSQIIFVFLLGFLLMPRLVAAADATDMQRAQAIDKQRAMDLLDIAMDEGNLTLLRLQNKLEEARAIDVKLYAKLQSILEKDQENFTAWQILSSLKRYDGADGRPEHAKALAILDTRIQSHPDWAFQYAERGDTHKSGQELVDAEMDYKQALSLSTNPQQSELYRSNLQSIERRMIKP